jgi:fused signal recognition particle receptor
VFSGLFRRDERLERGVEKTRVSVFGRLSGLFRRTEIDEGLWDELEETLIGADSGVATAEALVARLRARARAGEVRTAEQVLEALQEELVGLLAPAGVPSPLLEGALTVILMVGVNGVGKTTTVAKLASYWQGQGRRVLLAAGDTYRAAGSEQLEVWADRLGIPCVGSQAGADPGAIVFDAIASAKARGFDVVVADTAGRLHTKTNLMEELRKIRRVVDRQEVAARSLLVLDAAIGQNAVVQARSFAGAAGVDGIVVTKLDGTAKGGVVFSIVRELGAPVRFLGMGEAVEDIVEFDARAFVRAIFGGSSDV